MKENQKNEVKGIFLKSKPRFEGLDGLRGVASIIVVIFHLFETFSIDPTQQIVNHGYLAVDFFYVLSGFVISYAYDDRWNRMSLWDFYKRRLVRLHPMVIAGSLMGVCYYFLGESDAFPNIKDIKPHIFFITILMNILMIPTPKNLDVRGWGETNAFNGTNWTLTYEYLANILYSLIIRRLNVIIISIITLLSALLTINLTLNFDIFNVLQNRDLRAYTVIGGWEISSCELYIGFARLLYPFFCGYLISRLKLKITIPFSFIISSIILTICLCMPRIDGGRLIINGIFETIVIVIIFPLIVIFGAGEKEENETILKICKYLGEFSYPLYISHYPVIYCHIAWAVYHGDDSLFNKIGVSVGCFFILIFNTYALMKLYDEPVRKWLTERYLIKKKNKDELDKKVLNIEKDDDKNKENDEKIMDDSVNDNEDDSKNIKLLNDNNDNDNDNNDNCNEQPQK